MLTTPPKPLNKERALPPLLAKTGEEGCDFGEASFHLVIDGLARSVRHGFDQGVQDVLTVEM